MRALNSGVSFVRKNDAKTLPDQDLSNGATASATNSMLEERVQRILRTVESGNTFRVRDLALEVHLSPSHLQRLFKHQTGVSIGGWLHEQRLQRAAHLLANRYLSVKEIAYTIGYEHASSFVRAFGRRFAQAPAHYRKHIDCTKC